MNYTSLVKDYLKLHHPNAPSAEKNAEETFLRLLTLHHGWIKRLAFQTIRVGIPNKSEMSIWASKNNQLQLL